MNILSKFFKRFSRWHPKIALRYLPIVEEINRIDEHGSILEVGSGSLGIAPYIGREVTGIDRDFSGPEYSELKQVRGDAAKLPFVNDAYDFVVNVDVLEHIVPEKRQQVILESMRVAKRALFIAVPVGTKAEDQDKILAKKYQDIYKKPFVFLTEHLTYGLPKENEMITMIKDASQKLDKKVRILTYGNLNLTVRYFLMWGWMTRYFLIDLLFRKIFLLFIPLLRRCNWQPTYRQLFFIYIS